MTTPRFYTNPPYQSYFPFLAKVLVPLQVTQFLEGPSPGSNYGVALKQLNFLIYYALTHCFEAISFITP